VLAIRCLRARLSAAPSVEKQVSTFQSFQTEALRDFNVLADHVILEPPS
jgi:hypothetical protein